MRSGAGTGRAKGVRYLCTACEQDVQIGDTMVRLHGVRIIAGWVVNLITCTVCAGGQR